MHHPDFQKLEGTWRGLNYLVMNTETSPQLKIRCSTSPSASCSRTSTRRSSSTRARSSRSSTRSSSACPAANRTAALIGDYEFTNHPRTSICWPRCRNVSAAGVLPVHLGGLARAVRLRRTGGPDQAARPGEDLRHDRVHQVAETYRDSEDSRFVSWCCRACCRGCPYGANTKPIDEFGYRGGRWTRAARRARAARAVRLDERRLRDGDADDRRLRQATASAPPSAGRRAAARSRACRPTSSLSDDGDLDLKCPTEIGITDRREAELSKLGFLPLCHYKNTDYAVFFGGQTDAEAQEVRPARGDGERGASRRGCRTSWRRRGSPTTSR